MTLRLELQEERRKLRKTDIGDTFDCSACRHGEDDAAPWAKHRYCWRDHDRPAPVQFGFRGPVLLMEKRMLLQMLPPIEGAYNALMQRTAMMRINGKRVCPVPLCYTHEVNRVLDMEADMSCGEGGWGIPAFDGPTRKWPRDVLAILRHVRAVNGLIQQKRIDAETEKPNG